MWISSICPKFFRVTFFSELVQAAGRAKVTLMLFGSQMKRTEKTKKRIFANQVMKTTPSEVFRVHLSPFESVRVNSTPLQSIRVHSSSSESIRVHQIPIRYDCFQDEF